MDVAPEGPVRGVGGGSVGGGSVAGGCEGGGGGGSIGTGSSTIGAHSGNGVCVFGRRFDSGAKVMVVIGSKAHITYDME